MSHYPICSRHLADLNTALRHKGLLPLCKWESQEEIKQFATTWLQGSAVRESFDPRIVAILEIQAKARQMRFNTHACPLCTIPKVTSNTAAAASWLDNISDLMVIVARTNELM